jgi:hypothetical protein
VKTKRIKVERDEKAEICIRRSKHSFTIAPVGPCTISVVIEKKKTKQEKDDGRL